MATKKLATIVHNSLSCVFALGSAQCASIQEHRQMCLLNTTVFAKSKYIHHAQTNCERIRRRFLKFPTAYSDKRGRTDTEWKSCFKEDQNMPDKNKTKQSTNSGKGKKKKHQISINCT